MYGIKYYVYVFLSKSISVFVFLCIILLTTMTIYTQGDVWPHHHATLMSSCLRHLSHVQLHLTVFPQLLWSPSSWLRRNPAPN